VEVIDHTFVCSTDLNGQFNTNRQEVATTIFATKKIPVFQRQHQQSLTIEKRAPYYSKKIFQIYRSVIGKSTTPNPIILG
jgi:hypothetical protein